MSGRFRHSQHVLRVALLFAFGFLTFILVRWALVPRDFGLYGFYRAGALTDIAALPRHYAGQGACADCHGDVVEARAANSHKNVHCEACHGPLGRHAAGEFEVKPINLNPRTLCLTCHTQSAGKPATFPQIAPADHGGDGPCTDCHHPHAPKIVLE
jgi:hypothetical protein